MSKPNVSSVRFFDPAKDKLVLDAVQENSHDISNPGFPTPPQYQLDEPELNVEDTSSPNQIELDNTISQVSAIQEDIEDDIYNRDGGTNESEMASERLKNLTGKLSGSFLNSATSGLMLLRDMAIVKKDKAKSEEAQIEFQNEREEKKQTEEQKAKEDFDEGINSKVSTSLTDVDEKGILKDWDKRSFAFGDVDIDAEGWDNIMSIMRDPRKRKAAFDKIAKEKGWTQEERDAAETDTIEAAEIMWRIKHGQGTPEDIERLKVIGQENPKAIEAAEILSKEKESVLENRVKPQMTSTIGNITEEYNSKAAPVESKEQEATIVQTNANDVSEPILEKQDVTKIALADKINNQSIPTSQTPKPVALDHFL